MATEVWSGNQGTLCVYVSKAKDLPNLNKLDKQNVMLRLRIAHMTRESEVLLRAGQNPVFNYLERYEITPEIRPVMQVEAYCDRKKKPPILIGRCEVDLLNGIRADPREGYCSWYELKQERNEFAGTIFIELTFTPSLPRSHREKRSEEIERLDASMVRRPVPPLPGDLYESHSTMETHNNGRSYMHASAMRDVTPQASSYGEPTTDFSLSMPPLNTYPSNFESSVGTSRSSGSQETNITTTSDTKFHFANLKKLKERINVFKNANVSVNNSGNESDVSVDIKALQKAIGVTANDVESDQDGWKDDTYGGDRRTSAISDIGGQHEQPALPPLPAHIDNIKTVQMPTSKNSRLSGMNVYEGNYASPNRQRPSSPQLPPLPNSPHARNASPIRRKRPPPAI